MVPPSPSTSLSLSTAPLPDLVISSLTIELENGGNCIDRSTPLGTTVVVENVGAARAGPFVIDLNGKQQAVLPGLVAGQAVSVWLPDSACGSETVVMVDANFQVEESEEGNNRISRMVPTPTQPPTCTPPIPTGTPGDTAVSPFPPTQISIPGPTLTPSRVPPTPTRKPTAVTVRSGQITIPTYPYAQYLSEAWNETYNLPYQALDRPAYEAAAPTPAPVVYQTLVVENEYLRLTFLPDLGGRLYEVFFKPSGHPVTYHNPVLKPSPWGPPEQGWWLAAGGIEWCFPVEEHGYEWGMPWITTTSQDASGVTVTVRDSEASDRVRVEIAVRLNAGAGFFTIRPRLENPTGAPVDVKFWTNAMLAPGGQNSPSAELRFILADHVSTVAVHSRGDDTLPAVGEKMPWPIANGIDMGRLGNWNRWLGFFEDPVAGEFAAVYDQSYDEGIVRLVAADVERGSKVFAHGWGDPIAPENWTDGDSSYVELHSGPSPTFGDSVSLPAGGSLEWTETWYPIARLGGLRYANEVAAIDLTAGGMEARLAVAVSRRWSGDIVLLLDGQERWKTGVTLMPGQAIRHTLPLGVDAPHTGHLAIRLIEAPSGAVAVEYGATFELR